MLIVFFFLPACKPENIDTSENDQQFFDNESNPPILFDEDEKSILAETLQHNVRFEHYLHQNEDPYSIVNNYVYDILNDERGFLWVGTGNGLDRFDPESGRFFHYQEKTNAGLTEFGLGTWKGIKRFDLESGYFLDGQEVAGLPQGIIANQISSIAEAADGRLWLGTLEGELLIFDPLDGTYKRFQPDSTEGSVSDPNDIYNVMIDRYGLIWVAAGDLFWLSGLQECPLWAH